MDDRPADRGKGDGCGESAQMERKHVFVVNSAPEFLDFVRELLQDEHYNVTTTNFVPRTFDQIEALGPDLLLIDLKVGQRAGWDLLEEIQAGAVTQGIPVVVTSTDPRLLERAEAEQSKYGGNVRLAKPFDLDDLLTAVRDLIGGA